MPIANEYNPNPSTVDSILRKRQTQVDLAREQGLIPDAQPVEATKPHKILGVEQTADYKGKSFFRKTFEDAAMLAYAIPVGVAQAVTHPVDFVKKAPGALYQSVKDLVNPDYYKAHPLLGIVNLFGFAAPIAGVAKNVALKTALRTTLATGTKEAVALGVSEEVARTALSFGMKEVGGALVKKGAIGTSIWEAAKTGKVELVTETVKNLLKTNGVADDVALRVATKMSDNLYSTFSRQTTKLKTLEAIAHPVSSGKQYLSTKLEPLRQAVFGNSAETAVGKLYGADTVAKNPEGFVQIERWADAQLKEQGIESSVANRQRIMQNWVDQNSEWASLTPEERISHFQNYAEQDLKRLVIHEATGMDIVTTKALPQNYVDSMVATIKEAPSELDMPQLMELMEDTYGKDFSSHSAEIAKAVAKNGTKEGLIDVVSKLGDKRSLISFQKFSEPIRKLADELEQTGYRIGYAPKDKPVSFVTDTLGNASDIPVSAAITKRTALGNWIDKLGLSPTGVIEGAAEFQYRENFTQNLLGDFADKYGGIIKAKNIKSNGLVSIPVEKLFEWLDKNKAVIRGVREKASLPVRTVFDLKEADLVRAGFTKEVARDIVSISNKSLSAVPASVTGMADKVINFMRTRDKGYNAWMSRVYDTYLKVAYKGRYDLSPFFSAQEFVETKLNSALFLKDPTLLAGGKTLSRMGAWTAERLGKNLEGTASYLRKIVDNPPLGEVKMVSEEVLGTLQKTMLDYTSSPDIIGVQNAAMGLKGLAGEAAFEQSIKSRNFWYGLTGQSSVRIATTFNKALAAKFGMSLENALSFTLENGVKKYSNPQMLQMMREATQELFHYKPGVLTSPLVKTMNVVWFPFRFEAKTVSLVSKWASNLSPTSRAVVMNNWVNFANWAGTEEGIKWRRTNRNWLYNIFSYVTAYEQIGQSIEAVSKGRIFGGNTGIIGGVPFGFMTNLARELAILPDDPDQFDPKTGERFKKTTPKELVSAASLSTALEQLSISIMPSTPFYSLTGGIIAGVSPSKVTTPLIRSVVGATRESIEGRSPDKGKAQLEKDFKKVPLEYNRLSQ